VKRILIPIGGIILIALVVYLIGAGNNGETKAKPRSKTKRAVSVETVSVKRGSLERRLNLTGTVRSEATVDVFSKVAGTLEELHVEQGDRITEDQTIGKVEGEEREAQVQEAEAALEVLRAGWAQIETGARPEEISQAEDLVRQAKARWVNSVDSFKRLESLVKRKAISQQRYDEAKHQVTIDQAGYRSARKKLVLLKKGAREEDRRAFGAQIRKAEATLRLARSRLDNTKIRAPIGGIIGTRYCDRGTFVSTSKPIVRIVDMDTVKVVVQVTERELAQLRVGSSARVSVDAYPENGFLGQIARISPTLDPESRTADVEIKLDNRDHRLKPGMYARVNLLVQSSDGGLLVPRDALLRGEGPPRVYVNAQGVASLKKVKLGLQGEHQLEVLDGLQEGDEVVIAGHYQLKDGMAVQVRRRPGQP
jgi:multidrug efflux pump subunit AcrA (membrane-fusion protein)